MDSERMQSWVEEHKLSTIGGVWAAAVGASVAYRHSRRRAAPQRAAGPRLVHARARTLAALGGAAAALASVHYRSSKADAADRMDLDFYSQLPPAADADGNENERWSW